jgi:cholesterol transport system auxiliary component
MNRYVCGMLMLAISGAILSGCLKLERTRPERQFYMLEAERPETPAAAKPHGALRVHRFQAGPAYDTPAFIYRTGLHGYESDFYNAFFVQPAAMITERSMQWLGASGLFGPVGTSSSQVRAPYMLEGTLVSVHGDYRNPERPEAVIELQVILFRDEPGKPEIVHQAEYAAREPVTENTAEGLVMAWNRALSSILSRMENELAQALASQAGSAG